MPERDVWKPQRDFWDENALEYCNRLPSEYVGITGTKIVLNSAQKNVLAGISMESLYRVALAPIEKEFADYINSMSRQVERDLTIIPVTGFAGFNKQTHINYIAFVNWFTNLFAYKQELANFDVLYSIKGRLSRGCFTDTRWDVLLTQARHMMTQKLRSLRVAAPPHFLSHGYGYTLNIDDDRNEKTPQSQDAPTASALQEKNVLQQLQAPQIIVNICKYTRNRF